ncbi:MAG: phage tail tape measure protein [Rhizobiaceae bacterium]|nr:phage tail tape measure protein [Rhizobiaceae bacterium]
MDDDVTIRFAADTTAFERSLKQMQLDADRFGAILTGALKKAVVEGASLEDVLRGIGLQLASQALSMGLKPLQGLLSGAIGGLLGPLMPFAKGGVPGLSSGIVSTPTVFGAGGRLGVMGEAGAEAILPLRRDASGRLGVGGGGAGGAPVTINMTVSTPDAGSFRKSEAQIAAMLARTVARGQRGL